MPCNFKNNFSSFVNLYLLILRIVCNYFMEYKSNQTNLKDINFGIRCKFQWHLNSFDIHLDMFDTMNLASLDRFKITNNILKDMFYQINYFYISIFQHRLEEPYSEYHCKNSKMYYQKCCKKHKGINMQYLVLIQITIIQLQIEATSLNKFYIRNLFLKNFIYFIRMDLSNFISLKCLFHCSIKIHNHTN